MKYLSVSCCIVGNEGCRFKKKKKKKKQSKGQFTQITKHILHTDSLYL